MQLQEELGFCTQLFLGEKRFHIKKYMYQEIESLVFSQRIRSLGKGVFYISKFKKQTNSWEYVSAGRLLA